MDQFESPPGQSRTGIIVIGLVVVGLVLVGVGGYLVWQKKQGGGGSTLSADSAEFSRWCELRKEWERKVEPLVGDILLKSVKPQDAAEREKLVVQRNMLCQEYARKLREMGVTDPAAQEVEVALVKEGKTRSNVSVEIDNLLAKIEGPDTAALREARDKLERYIKGRIGQARALADKEIAAAFAKAGGKTCASFFRGPMTDQGTTGNPYESWDEIELKRTQAMKRFDDKITEMEPLEQFTNRVYHEMVRLYHGTLTKCYKQAKANNPGMSDKLGLRVRLKPSGKVATLGIEWMINREEKILDCLLETASKWRLPQPDPKYNVVVVTLDFTRL